jgi:hypothetical protein
VNRSDTGDLLEDGRGGQPRSPIRAALGHFLAVPNGVRARPRERQFDPPGTAETLYDAGTLILHGASGVFGAYAEYQAYLRQEADQS